MEYNTYLSDDEVDIENEQNVEVDQYGMCIEEVNEDEELEMRRIISNKLLSRNNLNEEFFIENNISKKKIFKESKSPKKKSLSLNDLNNLIDKKLEDKKPKKFISKRSIEKKNSEPTLINVKETKSKRHFNPRLIPYLFSEEYKNKKLCDKSKILIINNLEFPDL
jgi:hypothetical protein